MILRRFVIVLFTAVLFISCSTGSSQADYSKDRLIEFFRTDDVSIIQKGERLEIRVLDSKKIEKTKETLGNKWINAEAITSVGVVDFVKQVGQFKGIESLVVDVLYEGKGERYVYAVNDISHIIEFESTGKDFLRAGNDIGASEAKQYLGTSVLDKVPGNKLDTLCSSIFLKQKITKIETVGVALKNGKASIYFNVYYINGEGQTYALTYYMNGDGKIGGIKVPQAS
ncbi:hypothetical protein [Taibaiella soli]|uniref:PepSY domain-containing protein n=1 Tax=Taibaiella soli TaxID=1649169 RepID=A0A2W2B643_9BACT|nr:hypothetical protein [Taibaiella soli]PZF71679.1 hypothetical protein DN068_16555 [Taibaiella soli]